MLVLLLTLAIAASDDCVFTVKGETYDLSGLKGQTVEGNDQKVSTYQYKASVCSDMEVQCQDIMTGETLSGAIYQYGGGSQPGSKQVCWDVLAFWDEKNIVAGPLATSTTGIQSNDTGVALTFSNGDECRNAPRKSTLNMICSDSDGVPGHLSGFQDEQDSCHFIINWRTSEACSGPPKTTKPPTPKWGINGTFTGDLECIADKNSCTLSTTDNQLRGDCDNMKLVTVTGGKYEVWEMDFEECGGYYFSGTMEAANSEMKFKMHGSFMTTTNTLEIQMVDDDFPYEAMYKLSMNKIDDNRRLLSL